MDSTSLEVQWEQRPPGHGQLMGLVSTTLGWMSIQFCWARTVNKGPLLSWRRLKVQIWGPHMGWTGQQGEQSCSEVLSFISGAEPCSLAWGDSRAQKRLLLFGGRRKLNPIPSPSPPHWLSPSSLLAGAPDTALLREPAPGVPTSCLQLPAQTWCLLSPLS